MGHTNKVTHNEEWWELLAPPHVIRCSGTYKTTGLPCRREAIPGATRCREHGGAIPAVRAKAAARIGNAADEMVKRLLAMLDDPGVDPREKIKVAQDMLDRAGLNATERLIIGTGDVSDPVEKLFQDLLSDPRNFQAPPPAHSDPTIEAYNREALEAYGGDVVQGEVVSAPEGRRDRAIEAPKTRQGRVVPPHIREGLDRAEEVRRLI